MEETGGHPPLPLLSSIIHAAAPANKSVDIGSIIVKCMILYIRFLFLYHQGASH